MPITPLDIYQKEFKKVLRGIDPDEVEDFLEQVADDYELLIKENARLKEQISVLEEQFNAGERPVRSDIAEANIRADTDDIIREAKKEADMLIREARKEAENMIRKAKDEAGDLRQNAMEDLDKPVYKELEADKDELLEKSKMEALNLRGEISKLKAQKERFLIDYRELLEKHLKFLTEKA